MPPFVITLLQATQDSSGSGEGSPPAPGFGGLMELIPLFALLYFIAYFMMIRPQRKQQKQHQKLLESLKKNDEVRTSGGVYGKVVSVDGDKGVVTLKVDEQNNVRLRVARSAIVDVVDKKSDPGTEKNQKSEKAGAT